jgi:Uma2 family endonuclease
MPQAALKLPDLMTVDAFQHWKGTPGERYELVEGVPRAMAPASDAHGTIQTNLITAIANHLAVHRPACRLVTAPGIQPRLRANWNHRIPELGVTCATNLPGMIMMPEPILLIEILSPGNADDTWSNVPLYATVPTVQEIVLVDSTEVQIDILRRSADGNWPLNPDVVTGIAASITLASVGATLPLATIYRHTWLASEM